MESSFKPVGIVDPNDVCIAVMGLTGAGKSSFIATCTGSDVHIGHDLSSCTTSVSMWPMTYQGRKVHLIDTPGFNDTARSESTIFKEIAYWLSKSHESAVLLNGIIYLHSVQEPRFTATARRNLELLKAMTGPENFKSIILSTTFWSTENMSAQEDRVAQLVSDYGKWGELEKGGSKVYAHSAGRTSALAMINHIVQSNTKYTLAIQKELSSGDIDLSDTLAGRMMADAWRDDLKKFKHQLDDAKSDLQEVAAASCKKAGDSIETLRALIATRREDVAELDQRRNELHAFWETRMRQDILTLELATRNNQIALENLRERRLAAQKNDQDLSAARWQWEYERLREQQQHLEREKMTRLTEWGLSVGVMSMVSSVLSTAATLAPAAMHAAAPALGTVAVAACSVM